VLIPATEIRHMLEVSTPVQISNQGKMFSRAEWDFKYVIHISKEVKWAELTQDYPMLSNEKENK
jgi:hypothetical protein